MNWKKAFWEGTMGDLIQALLPALADDVQAKKELYVASCRLLMEAAEGAMAEPSLSDQELEFAIGENRMKFAAWKHAHNEQRRAVLEAGLQTAR